MSARAHPLPHNPFPYPTPDAPVCGSNSGTNRCGVWVPEYEGRRVVRGLIWTGSDMHERVLVAHRETPRRKQLAAAKGIFRVD